MEFNRKTQTVKSFARDMKNEKYNMFHKLQRKEGQWKNYEQSLLIDSMLRNYPVDPIRSEEKEDKIRYVFDGVQRSTTIRDFLADGFKLNQKLKSVAIEGAAYTCVKNEKDFDEFINIVQAFVNSYGDNMDYIQYCTSGTSSAQSVQGRFNYWKNLCKGL